MDGAGFEAMADAVPPPPPPPPGVPAVAPPPPPPTVTQVTQHHAIAAPVPAMPKAPKVQRQKEHLPEFGTQVYNPRRPPTNTMQCTWPLEGVIDQLQFAGLNGAAAGPCSPAKPAADLGGAHSNPAPPPPTGREARPPAPSPRVPRVPRRAAA